MGKLQNGVALADGGTATLFNGQHTRRLGTLNVWWTQALDVPELNTCSTGGNMAVYNRVSSCIGPRRPPSDHLDHISPQPQRQRRQQDIIDGNSDSERVAVRPQWQR